MVSTAASRPVTGSSPNGPYSTTSSASKRVRVSLQQRNGQFPAAVEEVFAIVEQQQHVSVGNEPQQDVHGGAARLIRQTQRACRSDRQESSVGDRRQIDIPHSVAALGDELSRELHWKSRLAGPARAGQGDQTVVGHTLTYLGHFGVTADKPRQLGRKVMRANGFRYAKLRELVADLGVAELRHVFGAGQITA